MQWRGSFTEWLCKGFLLILEIPAPYAWSKHQVRSLSVSLSGSTKLVINIHKLSCPALHLVRIIKRNFQGPPQARKQKTKDIQTQVAQVAQVAQEISHWYPIAWWSGGARPSPAGFRPRTCLKTLQGRQIYQYATFLNFLRESQLRNEKSW